MSDNDKSQTRQEKPKKKPVKIPLLSVPIAFFFKYLGVFIGAGFTCLLIEFVIYGYDTFNGTSGLDKSVIRFNTALESTEHLGKWLDVKEVYNWVIAEIQFYVDKLVTFLSSYPQYTNIFTMPFKHYQSEITYLEEGTTIFQEVLYVWLISTMTWVLKLLTVVSYIPLYLFVGFAGLVNGMVERKFRMFTGEPDSSDKTEWWYGKARIASLTVLFGYFAMPHSFHPFYFFLPSIFFLGYVIRKLATNYKVYW